MFVFSQIYLQNAARKTKSVEFLSNHDIIFGLGDKKKSTSYMFKLY